MVNAATMQQRFAALDALYEKSYSTSGERAKAVDSAFLARFSDLLNPSKVSALSNDDLRYAFSAANIAASATSDASITRAMWQVLDALSKRKLATRSDRANYWGQLVMERRMDEANAYSRAIPGNALPLQPVIKRAASAGSPAFLEATDASKRVFISVPVDVTEGARVIVVGHPYCHFTRNAVAAIDQEPELSAAIGKVAMFIMPPRRTLDSTEAEDWNKAHPREAMHLVERKTDWPMVDSWDTPTFYFLRNGRVVTKVTGWPREGHMSELMAGLARIGVNVSGEP
ncbi:hypothetical protein [Luteibacter sp. CQ10]|uniref:hypothetical protein n=1 Tax=Luteibacter sp. CQ10 TaxID=2805821 RepID=UPI0034A27424